VKKEKLIFVAWLQTKMIEMEGTLSLFSTKKKHRCMR
jgi:hypothetical protein